jgi:hypothetical protein
MFPLENSITVETKTKTIKPVPMKFNIKSFSFHNSNVCPVLITPGLFICIRIFFLEKGCKFLMRYEKAKNVLRKDI